MGHQPLSLPMIKRSVHLCVDMQRIFSAGSPLANAMDGQGLAGRGGSREPSSRTNGLHSLHPARTSPPDAGHVAALLHSVTRGDPRVP